MKNNINDELFNVILKESIEKYAAKINDEDISSEITDAEINSQSERKSRIYKNIKREIAKERKRTRSKPLFSIKKVLTLAAVVVAIGMLLAFNVSALRIFIFKTYVDVKDNVLNISTNNSMAEKYKVISEFQEIDELVIPSWLPKGSNLEKIQDDVANVTLSYTIGDKYLRISEDQILSSDVHDHLQIENNQYNIQKRKIMGFEGTIVKVESELNLINYTIVWNSDSIRYSISTNVSDTMLNTILSGLKYYKKQ